MRTLHIPSVERIFRDKVRGCTIDEKSSGDVLSSIIRNSLIYEIITYGEMISIRDVHEFGNVPRFESREQGFGSSEPGLEIFRIQAGGAFKR